MQCWMLIMCLELLQLLRWYLYCNIKMAVAVGQLTKQSYFIGWIF